MEREEDVDQVGGGAAIESSACVVCGQEEMGKGCGGGGGERMEEGEVNWTG